VFPIFVGLAVAYRRKSDYHKRFMLLASLGMLTAAIARFQVLQVGGLPLFFAVTDAILLSCVAIDTMRNRRLHPAFAGGMAFILASQVARFLGAGTPQWMEFARWLTAG